MSVIMSGSGLEDSVDAGEKPHMSKDITQAKLDTHVTEIDDEDGRDPRNWSSRKKLFVFVALMSSSILADGYVASWPHVYHVLIDPITEE